MLNPAHALVGMSATNKANANEFVDWVVSGGGGQEVLRTFKKNGVLLYSVAPT
jgi:ABC-type Fe3+ transport system substrate-binding protein